MTSDDNAYQSAKKQLTKLLTNVVLFPDVRLLHHRSCFNWYIHVGDCMHGRLPTNAGPYSNIDTTLGFLSPHSIT